MFQVDTAGIEIYVSGELEIYSRLTVKAQRFINQGNTKFVLARKRTVEQKYKSGEHKMCLKLRVNHGTKIKIMETKKLFQVKR